MTLFAGGIALGWVPPAAAAFGAELCKQKEYQCVKVKKGQSWSSLFANGRQRELVMRLNRMNTRLRPGQVIAVPKKLSGLDLDDIAPFPQAIEAPQRSTLVVDQKKLAWGAYSPEGRLLKWGPMSGGKKWCADIKEKCHTPAGKYTVFRKEGADCKSSSFPVDKPGGGAPMPYCVFFNGGIAFHGSDSLPGYNASHGCVRMYTEDARWLNTRFIEMGRTQVLVDKNLPKARSGGAGAPNSAWNLGSQGQGGIEGFAWH
ncbi:MAG: L,D-transpeptidase [Gammaproteobacteria bacterium SHHR-1]